MTYSAPTRIRRPRHSRLNLPMRAPEAVIPYLGKGALHWKKWRPALALVRAALDTRPELRGAELIEAFPERDVDLGDRGRPSQSDLVARDGHLAGWAAFFTGPEATAAQLRNERFREVEIAPGSAGIAARKLIGGMVWGEVAIHDGAYA